MHAGATAERVALEDITKVGDRFVLKADEAVAVGARAHKMSKSRGNVVNPDVIVRAYGADSLRLYEMFMGPLRDTKVWSTQSVEGVHRFLARVWRLFENGALRPPRPCPSLASRFPRKHKVFVRVSAHCCLAAGFPVQ